MPSSAIGTKRKHASLSKFQSIEKIFPPERIHLVAGPERAGKTTLLFQFMDWIMEGDPVFGYNADHIPFCYVSVCHVQAECQSMADRAGIEVPVFSVAGRSQDDRTFEGVIALARRKVKKCELVLIDGIPGLATCRGSDYNENTAYLNKCLATVEAEGITVIGSSRFAKPRGDGSASTPIGSTAWTEMTSTQITIQRTPVLTERRVVLAPRGMEERNFYYRFNERGLFTVIENPESSKRKFFEEQIFAQPAGTELTTLEAMEYGEVAGLIKRSVEYCLTKLVREGKLVRVKNGVYLISRKQ